MTRVGGPRSAAMDDRHYTRMGKALKSRFNPAFRCSANAWLRERRNQVASTTAPLPSRALPGTAQSTSPSAYRLEARCSVRHPGASVLPAGTARLPLAMVYGQCSPRSELLFLGGPQR